MAELPERKTLDLTCYPPPKINIREWKYILKGKKRNQFVSSLVVDLENKNLITRRIDLKITLNSFTYI